MSERDPKPEEQEPVLVPYHVYPVGKHHRVEGEPCWCKPRVEEGGWVIVHNDVPQ